MRCYRAAVTRIISGRAGGKRLQTPPGKGTRPTSDRVREALFSRLEHLGAVHGAYVLDLYAGSGALGLEAVSRGAVAAVLVESDQRAAAVARRNATATGLPGLEVRAVPVERYLAGSPGRAADLVLLDPPYDLGDEALAGVLASITGGGWLAPDGLVVVERSSRTPQPRWPEGLALLAERRYGETTVWFADRPEPEELA